MVPVIARIARARQTMYIRDPLALSPDGRPWIGLFEQPSEPESLDQY